VAANSQEGGDFDVGSSICVPGWQQSWQGGKLNALKRKVLKDVANEANKYVLRIEGWDCASGRPHPELVTNCAGRMRRRDIETVPDQTITQGTLCVKETRVIANTAR
jgi:hypothetical protein